MRIRFGDLTVAVGLFVSFGPARADGFDGFDDLVQRLVFRAAFGRKREHRDFRFDIQQSAARIGGSKRDFGELAGIRVDHDAAIGVNHRAVRTEFFVGNDHQKERRNDLKTFADADTAQRGGNRVRGRIRRGWR